MAKKKTIEDYIEEIKEMIEQRTGRPYDRWYDMQVRATAMNMVVIDKLQAEIDKCDVTLSMAGSMGQQKIEMNPVFEKYIRAQTLLMNQLGSLGLNNSGTKGKAGGPGGDSSDEEDPVLALLTQKR
jgi:hypothetical protein